MNKNCLWYQNKPIILSNYPKKGTVFSFVTASKRSCVYNQQALDTSIESSNLIMTTKEISITEE